MRSLKKINGEMAELQEHLAILEREKEQAEKDAADPRGRRIREHYVAVWDLLERLDELGENVTDAEGYVLHIKGESFEIHPESGVQEV